jgi:hypothetical protein
MTFWGDQPDRVRLIAPFTETMAAFSLLFIECFLDSNIRRYDTPSFSEKRGKFMSPVLA